MTTDVFSKTQEFSTVKDLKSSGLYPYFVAMQGMEGTESRYQGRRIIMCGSNNYLGLTQHPKVREAAKAAIDEFGPSCTGSRFLNGTLDLHLELERELAAYTERESALVFATGMMVNLGVVSALVGKDDAVVLDKGDHASIVDGARLSFGKVHRYKHNDMRSLERTLQKLDGQATLVVVDGVYSMEGNLAPLPEITALCEKYNARLMVDDAHGIGVLGGGKGTGVHFGVHDKIDLIMGTFSKSLASIGGFVSGEEDVISYIQHVARSMIFTASIAPPNAAAALAALRVMQEEPERIEHLNANAAYMRQGFTSLGFDIGASETPIIPVMVRDDTRTFIFWQELLAAGIYVNAIISPATSDGNQLLRTSFMSEHTVDQMDEVLEVFGRIGKQVGLI